MNSKNMTECEMYITLAMRHVFNTDIVYNLSFSKRLGKFIKRYKESKGSRYWKLYGHPMNVMHCNYNCIDCWNRCTKEFVDNGEDRCDL